MQITGEFLKAKRQELFAERDKKLADLNAIEGGIELLDLLLARLDEPEPTAV